MSPGKTAAEVHGGELDWLATDADGHVALLSSAGGGYVPEAPLRDTDALEAAIEAILTLAITTEVRFAPVLAPDLVNTWRMVAERGLYAFDSDPNGGPYLLVAAPVVPIRLTSLPASVVQIVEAVRFPRVRFAEQTSLGRELLE